MVGQQRRVFSAILLAFLLGITLLFSGITHAQDLACGALVEQALTQIEDNCEGLERNSACYGHNQVLSTFAGAQPAGFFSEPADQAPLITLESLHTTALNEALGQWGIAVLNVQANLPNALPGQGIVFLLLGDVTLENDVAPQDALRLIDGIPVTTATRTDLRSSPGLSAGLLVSVEEGTTFLADGISADGNWLRVVHDDTPAWVGLGALLTVVLLDDLPVISPEQRTPMQAFRFSTGVGAPQCSEAESALVVQGPEEISVDLTVNGVDIRVGSLVTFQSVADNQIRLTVNEGRVDTADGRVIQAGETITATVDEAMTVMSWSQPQAATPEELAAGQRARPVIDDLAGVMRIDQPQADWTVGTLLAVDNVDGVWQRFEPDSESDLIIAVLPNDAPVSVVGGPQADGRQWWWEVRDDDGLTTGWIEQSQLRERNISVAPPTAPPAPTAAGCTPRTDWAETYTVERGDTLSSIAQRGAVGLSELQQGNCIVDAARINTGQVLRVPRPVQPPPTVPPPTAPPPTDDPCGPIAGDNEFRNVRVDYNGGSVQLNGSISFPCGDQQDTITAEWVNVPANASSNSQGRLSISCSGTGVEYVVIEFSDGSRRDCLQTYNFIQLFYQGFPTQISFTIRLEDGMDAFVNWSVTMNVLTG